MNQISVVKVKALFIILVAAIFFSISAQNVLAKDVTEVIDVKGKKEYRQLEQGKEGFFLGGGPLLGFEMNVMMTVGGGAVLELGYRFNNMYSLMLQGNLYYTRYRSVNYFIVPVMPVFKMNFDTGFNLIIGGGYDYMWTGRGQKINEPVSTPSKSYNGWNVIVGGGYEIWLNEDISITPEVILNYTRIASSNLILPNARLVFNWLF